MLFSPNFVYPNDGKSDYVELEGRITFVEPKQFRDGAYQIDVVTDHGVFTGYWDGPPSITGPEIGYMARIRVYRSGGGYYPDNEIRGWTTDIVANIMCS